MAEEYNARREEITELGNAVGLDVAKLHEQLGQMAEAERRARDALARRVGRPVLVLAHWLHWKA